jgi:hypothetical protein
MNLRSNRAFLLAGVLLIVVANTIVILGVMHNRRSRAETTLMLTERELAPSSSWSPSEENSGLDLRIEIRTDTTYFRNSQESEGNEAVPMWGVTPWLTAAKLRSLGFPLLSTRNADEDRRHNEKLLARDVYLVLELAGGTYQRALQHAQADAARAVQLAAAAPEDKVLAERAERNQRLAEAELNQESRLFCIDAGLDPIALRNTYADRTTFAIVRGSIRPTVYEHAGQWRAVGQYAGLRIPQLNVPLIYRPVFGARQQPRYVDAIALAIAGPMRDRKEAPHYNVSVAWGSRLEPWMVSASILGDIRPGERQ